VDRDSEEKARLTPRITARAEVLTAVRIPNASSVHAWEQSRADGPWHCPECRSDVVLKRGRIVVAHFAHKPPTCCEYGVGESWEHRRSKFELFQALSRDARVTSLELERDLGRVRPDLYATIDGVDVAIEVQISALSMDTIERRTTEYRRQGIAVLWLAIWCPALAEKRYAPRSWEKWLHAAYFGRVYYFCPGAGLRLAAYHFDEHRLWVEESSWYDESGYEQSAGGYDRRSRRYRTPKRGPTLHLIDDFAACNRTSWDGGTISVPAARLYLDTKAQWWQASSSRSAPPGSSRSRQGLDILHRGWKKGTPKEVERETKSVSVDEGLARRRGRAEAGLG
jgi:competence protein CoiA